MLQREQAKYYSRRKRFGVKNTDDVKNLKALEDKDARLKKRLAERNLGSEVIKQITQKINAPGWRALAIERGIV